jgi:hypothetical protein
MRIMSGNFMFLDCITLIVFGEKYELWDSPALPHVLVQNNNLIMYTIQSVVSPNIVAAAAQIYERAMLSKILTSEIKSVTHASL